MRWRVACALGILATLAVLTACERRTAQVTGTVKSSETGFPLSGVAVRLGDAQTTTDTLGQYAVSIRRPGSQKLYAWLSGYEPYSTEITVGSSSVEWSFTLLRQPVSVTRTPTESKRALAVNRLARRRQGHRRRSPLCQAPAKLERGEKTLKCRKGWF